MCAYTDTYNITSAAVTPDAQWVVEWYRPRDVSAPGGPKSKSADGYVGLAYGKSFLNAGTELDMVAYAPGRCD